MRAVDTNVLVRLFTGDDPRQTASAERFIEQGVWVSSLALAETVWVLVRIYGFDGTRLVRAIEMLLKNGSVALQDREAVVAVLNLFRDKPSLGFSDCWILEIARKAGHLPLGTFDRKLAKIDGTHKL